MIQAKAANKMETTRSQGCIFFNPSMICIRCSAEILLFKNQTSPNPKAREMVNLIVDPRLNFTKASSIDY
jgi:hypothetical protein